MDFIPHPFGGDLFQTRQNNLQMKLNLYTAPVRSSKNLIIGILSLAAVLFAQPVQSKTRLYPFLSEVGVYSGISGNNFGIRLVPYVSLKIVKRVHLIGGPILTMNGKMYGLHSEVRVTTMSYYSSTSGRNTVYFNVGYDHFTDARLTETACAIEQSLQPTDRNASANFSSMRLSGWQASAGFGVGHQFFEHVVLHGGLSVAYHEIQPLDGSCISMERAKGTSLMLRLGISWKFGTSLARL